MRIDTSGKILKIFYVCGNCMVHDAYHATVLTDQQPRKLIRELKAMESWRDTHLSLH